MIFVFDDGRRVQNETDVAFATSVALGSSVRGLALNDIDSLRALRTFGYLKRNALTFGECLEAIALNVCMMNECICPVLICDKPKTL